MAIVYSNKVIEIGVQMTQESRPTANVWHVRFDAEWGTDSIEAVVRDFANNWQDHVMLCMTNAVALNSFSYRSLDPLDGTVGELAPDPAKRLVGFIADNSFPPNTAWLVRKGTSTRPRGRRDGRCYLPGVGETSVDNVGDVLASVVADQDNRLLAFYNGISDVSTFAAGDRYPVVLETTEASRAPGSTPVTIDSRRVTSITCDSKVATQRERLR